MKRCVGLFKAGQTTLEIAKAVGCGRSTVYNDLKRAGYHLPGNIKDARQVLRHRTLKRSTIARTMRTHGAKWREISAYLKVGKTAVFSLLRKTR